MPNFAATLKSEITRLAKREIRSETAALKKPLPPSAATSPS